MDRGAWPRPAVIAGVLGARSTTVSSAVYFGSAMIYLESVEGLLPENERGATTSRPALRGG